MLFQKLIKAIIPDLLIADIDYSNCEEVEFTSGSLKLVSLRPKGQEYIDHLDFWDVNMDVNLVVLECFFEKLFILILSLLGFIEVKTLGFSVHEDACDAFGGNVVLIDELDWLQRIRLDNFKIDIVAFQIIKTFHEINGEGFSAEVF